MIGHRLAEGRWERMARDVFRLAGSSRTWRQSLMVACIAGGHDAAVSHRSAAALWSLAGFEPGGEAELTVPRHRKRAGPGIVHRNALSAVDMTTVDAIPVTTPARTIIDLASLVGRDAVEEALDDALRRRLVTIARIRWRLTELARLGRPGVVVVRRSSTRALKARCRRASSRPGSCVPSRQRACRSLCGSIPSR
jgi:predicted transcriptional regulator of viral defense system